MRMLKLFASLLLLGALASAAEAPSQQTPTRLPGAPDLPPQQTQERLPGAPDLSQVGMIDLPGSPGFDGIAYANGVLLMSHPADNTVELFDPAKRRLLGRIKDMSQPRDIAVDTAEGRIYIANSGAGNLVVLSAADYQVQRTISLPYPPQKLVYSPTARILFVSCGSSQRLLTVDPRLGTVTHVADAGGRPQSIAYDPGRKLLWVTIEDQKRVQAFDAELKPVKGFELAGTMPTGIIYDQQLDRLYVSVRFAVLALDPENGKEIARVPAPAGVDHLWLDAPSRTLFAAANGTVSVMHAGEKLSGDKELPVDVKGQVLAYDPGRRLLFLPGGREGRSKLLILKQLSAEPASRTAKK